MDVKALSKHGFFTVSSKEAEVDIGTTSPVVAVTVIMYVLEVMVDGMRSVP